MNHTLRPHQVLFSTLAAFVSIAVCALITQHTLPNDSASPILIASMGASAVLLFMVPSSPLSQPWSFVGGHLSAALVGVACAQFIANTSLAAASATGLAIAVMYLLRCLHPPGGATALLAILGGDAIHSLGFNYLLTPVALNVLAMLAVSQLLQRIVLRHHHNNLLLNTKQQDLPQLSLDDLQYALRSMDTYIDVNETDLQRIYALARAHHHQYASVAEK